MQRYFVHKARPALLGTAALRLPGISVPIVRLEIPVRPWPSRIERVEQRQAIGEDGEVALLLRQGFMTDPDDHLGDLGACSKRSIRNQASVTEQLGRL